MPPEFLSRLFSFQNIRIAEKVQFQGGALQFFYALHILPCVGFKAELGGKSIIYSADTFYSPEGLLKLRETGIISEARRVALMHHQAIQECDLLLHEAGMPPTHTPAAALKQARPCTVHRAPCVPEARGALREGGGWCTCAVAQCDRTVHRAAQRSVLCTVLHTLHCALSPHGALHGAFHGASHG